jgi:hypothetical protein
MSNFGGVSLLGDAEQIEHGGILDIIRSALVDAGSMASLGSGSCTMTRANGLSTCV